MKFPEIETRYACICETFPLPVVFHETYESALEWALDNQPLHRPYYIVKSVTTYMVCGMIDKNGKHKCVAEMREESYDKEAGT